MDGINGYGVGHEIGTEASEHGERHAAEYCARQVVSTELYAFYACAVERG